MSDNVITIFVLSVPRLSGAILDCFAYPFALAKTLHATVHSSPNYLKILQGLAHASSCAFTAMIATWW